MNLYKKINTYLLENHPLVWHSKVVQLSLTGFFLWLVSYVAGYVSTDIYDLQNHSIIAQYQYSGYAFFHIISVIIILSVWAIFFFRNNGFKRFYPICKGYFTKLFFLLFFPFLLLIFANLPFSFGAKNKTTSIFSNYNMDDYTDKINLAAPFLVHNVSDYAMNYRIYPKPFPLENINYDTEEEKWESGDLFIKKDNKFDTFNPYILNDEIVQFGSKKLILYQTHLDYLDKNKCNEITVIDSIYTLKNLPQLYKTSVLNYSYVFFNNHERSDLFNESGYPNEYVKSDYNDEEVYVKKVAPKIHNYIEDNNKLKIKEILEQLKSICQEFKIKNNLNSNLLTEFLDAKEYSNFNSQLVQFEKSIYHDEVVKLNYNSKQDLILKLETPKKIDEYDTHYTHFFCEMNKLFNVLEANHETNQFYLNKYEIVIQIFIVLGIIWLIILFEFTLLPSFLISIPVTGVIALLVPLFTYLVFNFEGTILIDNYIVSAVIILLATLLGLYYIKFKKMIISILMNMTYFIAPFIFYSPIYYLLKIEKKVKVIDLCLEDGYDIETIRPYRFLENPFLFFLASLLGILLFFLLLRKWKAYKE